MKKVRLLFRDISRLSVQKNLLKVRSTHQGDGIISAHVGLFPLVMFTTMANLRTTTVNRNISQRVVGFKSKYAILTKNFNGNPLQS